MLVALFQPDRREAHTRLRGRIEVHWPLAKNAANAIADQRRPGDCFGELVVERDQRPVYLLKLARSLRAPFSFSNRLFHEADLLGRRSAARGQSR